MFSNISKPQRLQNTSKFKTIIQYTKKGHFTQCYYC